MVLDTTLLVSKETSQLMDVKVWDSSNINEAKRKLCKKTKRQAFIPILSNIIYLTIKMTRLVKNYHENHRKSEISLGIEASMVTGTSIAVF